MKSLNLNKVCFVVRDEKHSKKVQEFLFENGYTWNGNRELRHLNQPALYLDTLSYDKIITYSNLDYFNSDNNRNTKIDIDKYMKPSKFEKIFNKLKEKKE